MTEWGGNALERAEEAVFHGVEEGSGGDEEGGREGRIAERMGGRGGGLVDGGNEGAERFEREALGKGEREAGESGEGKHEGAGGWTFEKRDGARSGRRERGEDARGETVVGKIGVVLTKQRGEMGVVVGGGIHVCGFHDARRWRSFSLPRAR